MSRHRPKEPIYTLYEVQGESDGTDGILPTLAWMGFQALMIEQFLCLNPRQENIDQIRTRAQCIARACASMTRKLEWCVEKDNEVMTEGWR